MVAHARRVRALRRADRRRWSRATRPATRGSRRSRSSAPTCWSAACTRRWCGRWSAARTSDRASYEFKAVMKSVLSGRRRGLSRVGRRPSCPPPDQRDAALGGGEGDAAEAFALARRVGRLQLEVAAAGCAARCRSRTGRRPRRGSDGRRRRTGSRRRCRVSCRRSGRVRSGGRARGSGRPGAAGAIPVTTREPGGISHSPTSNGFITRRAVALITGRTRSVSSAVARRRALSSPRASSSSRCSTSGWRRSRSTSRRAPRRSSRGRRRAG